MATRELLSAPAGRPGPRFLPVPVPVPVPGGRPRRFPEPAGRPRWPVTGGRPRRFRAAISPSALAADGRPRRFFPSAVFFTVIFLTLGISVSFYFLPLRVLFGHPARKLEHNRNFKQSLAFQAPPFLFPLNSPHFSADITKQVKFSDNTSPGELDARRFPTKSAGRTRKRAQAGTIVNSCYDET